MSNKRFRNLRFLEFLLGFTILIGFLLRVWNIDFGLPQVLHSDEPFIVDSAVRMVATGDMNPHFFEYPSLYIYLMAIIYGIYSLIGHADDMALLYVTGRCLTASLGTLMILVVYYVGRNLYTKRVGTLAAVFLAVMPLIVRNSHYITVDVPVTFLILLSFYFAHKIMITGKKKNYILGGIITGLAASTKYNGGLMLFLIYLAYILSPGKKRIAGIRDFMNSNFFLAAFLAAAVYLLTTPFSVLDFRKFLLDFCYQIYHVSNTHGQIFMGTSPGWIHFIEYTLKWGMGYYIEMLAICGVIYMLIHVLYALRSCSTIFRIGHTWLSIDLNMASMDAKIKSHILLLSWILPYYLIVGSWGVKFDRYIIPIMPFLAIAAAKFLSDSLTVIFNKIYGIFGIPDKFDKTPDKFDEIPDKFDKIANELDKFNESYDKKINKGEFKRYNKNKLKNRFNKNTISSLVTSLIIISILLFIIIPPLQASISIDRELGLTDTREVALEWVNENIPLDSRIIREQYTPEVEVLEKYDVTCAGYYLYRRTIKELIEGFDYVIISSGMYGRYYSHPAESASEIKFYDSLEESKENFELIMEFSQSKEHPGPTIRIYKIIR